MNQEIKARWLEALRSGQYSQTTGKLNDSNRGFCCLGVLCEVAVQDGVVVRRTDLDDEYFGSVGYATQEQVDDFGPDSLDEVWWQEEVLPGAVKRWAELMDDNPETNEQITKDDRVFRNLPLADLNDDYGLNFDQIADIIERDL